MTDPRTTALRLSSPAARSPRTAPRPSLLTAAGRCDSGAVMRLAHDLARDEVADAARRGRVRRYKVALRDALKSAWSTRGETIDGHAPTLAERMTAAKIAAPFYAPRLASVAHEIVGGGQIVQRVEIVIVNPEEPSGGAAGAADRTCL